MFDGCRYFKPLVLEECRCGIVQERLEKKLEAVPIVISQAAVSSSYMLATGRCGRRKRGEWRLDDPLCSPEQQVLKAASQELDLMPLRKNDLVMFVPTPSILNYQKNPYEGKSLADLRGPPNEGYFVGIIERTDPSDPKHDPSDMSQCRIRFPRQLPSGAVQKNRVGAASVSIGSGWLAFPLASLTTSVREFESLFTASFSPLFNFMLNPAKYGVERAGTKKRPTNDVMRHGAGVKRVTAPQSAEAILTELQQKIGKRECTVNVNELAQRCHLNPSQATAVKHALTADFGLALLQGPPGTGKTKTLLALLSAVLAVKKEDSRILVCAPSNAAVDEVAVRVLKDGIIQLGSTDTLRPKCVRVGNPQRITREEVKAISLEQALAESSSEIKDKKRGTQQADLEAITNRLDDITRELEAHQLAAMSAGVTGVATTKANSNSYVELQQEKRSLLARRKNLRENFTDDMKASLTRGREARIKEAQIFFATLSGSASELLTGTSFEWVIVDEAAQAVELSSLIPLRHEAYHIVMIGDPQQLPATVLSSSAKKYNYERSLFSRLQSVGVDVYMLSTQYRMRPEISSFPSAHFYSNRLKNDHSVVTRPPLLMHTAGSALFAPFKFFHLNSQENRNSISQSLCNREEAVFIANLLLNLLNNFGTGSAGSQKRPGQLPPIKPGIQPLGQINACGQIPTSGQIPPGERVSASQIAVVTPYRQQMLELQRLFRGQAALSEIEIATIDSFQGREKTVIVFSCVRSLSKATPSPTYTPTQSDAPMTDEDDEDDDTFSNVFGGAAKKRRRGPGAITTTLATGAITKFGGDQNRRPGEMGVGRPGEMGKRQGDVDMQPKHSIGFVADIRRLNVAITRARDALWIVGNSATLQAHPTWRALIAHTKDASTVQKSVPPTPVIDRYSALDRSVFVDVATTVDLLRKDPAYTVCARGQDTTQAFFNIIQRRFDILAQPR